MSEAQPSDVVQRPTGAPVTVRHWFRRYRTRELTLGDLRTMLANIDRLGLPDDTAITAHVVPGSKGQEIYSLETRRPSS